MSYPKQLVIVSAVRTIALCGLLAVLLVVLGAPGAAQVTSGSIFGTVIDQTGAAISGATVTVKSAETGVTRTVTSGGSGDFVVPNLLPGTYVITVEAPNFKKLEKKGVFLSAADKLNAGEFALAIGAASDTVTVTAESGQLQLQANSGERSDIITGKQINDIALNGRMVLDYVKLIPGVVSNFDGSASGTGGLDSFNINGTRANEHEFTIDGASNVDTGNNGGTHVTLNTDAIAEVKVLTSNYQAEFGKAGGGQVAITTKGGSNEFHGNGRFFHRNEGMNANGWFNNQDGVPVPIYRYNYVGYQLGGPVKKDKLFFFWGQEYYRQLIPGGGLNTFSVPTAGERQGDFSGDIITASAVDRTTGAPATFVDCDSTPATGCIYDPNTGLAFPGNAIDPARLPAAQQAVFTEIQKILNLYPAGNVNNFTFSNQLSYNNPRREDVLRIDYQFNDKNRMYGRWIKNTQETTSPMQTWNLNCMGQLQIPGGCVNKQTGWNLSLNWVSTITPTLLNEASVGPSVTRSSWVGKNLSVSKNNIDLPLLYSVTPDTSIPDIGFNGYTNRSFPWSYFGANPWFQANTTINVNDNLTWVKHKHTLKFGMFYQRNRKDQIAWGNSNGQFSFSGGPTSNCPAQVTCGIPYASALLGDFDWFQQSSARPIGFFRYNQLEFYAQDTWRITPRLTLDYGMRFAWIPPQYDAENQLGIFNPDLFDPAQAVSLYTSGPLAKTIIPGSGSLTNGIGQASNGYPAGGWDSKGILPEPRVGFAYELTADHKTVLRGGFGTSHDREQGNLVFNPVFSNPARVLTPYLTNDNIANLPNLSASGVLPILGNIVGADKSGDVPVIYSYSLGVQRDIGRGTTVDLAWVGTAGRHLVTARDINAISYGTAFTQAAQDPQKWMDAFGTGVQAVEPGLPDQYAQAGLSYTGNYAYDTEFLVPYKGYGNIEYYKFDGISNYNSLQASLQRRFGRDLTLGAAYTWSKVLTTASSDEEFQDPVDPRRLDYRVAEFDRTHVLAVNYIYSIPGISRHFGGPKWLSYVTDNFQISGITTFETGEPIGPSDLSLWTPANSLTGSNQWGKIPPIYLSGLSGVNKEVGTSQLDPSKIVTEVPVGGPFLTGRTPLRKGGMQNWDMSLFKNIPLGANENRYIQLRFEAFNIFNHPNFENVKTWCCWDGGPLNVVAASGSSPTHIVVNPRPANQPINHDYGNYFGEYYSQYSGGGGPRVLQLGAKIYF